MPAAARRPRNRPPLGRLEPSPLPDAPVPMLASLAAEPFDHPDWIAEPKYDGLRVLVRFDGEELTLTNKNGTKRVKVKSHPLIWSFVEAIRASLAGDGTALRRFYRVELAGTRQDWVLTLRPLDSQAASYLTSVTLKGRGNRLAVVDILEAGGDRSVMTIHEPAS